MVSPKKKPARSGPLSQTMQTIANAAVTWLARIQPEAARALGLKVSTSFIALPLLAGPADIEL